MHSKFNRNDVLTAEGPVLFTGNAVPNLAADMARHLNISLGRATVGRFSDGEVMVEILENVRGRDVYILQSTCAPTNDHLMEVMIMTDALKRASAGRITAALRLCAPGSPGTLDAGCHQCQGRGQHVADRRR